MMQTSSDQALIANSSVNTPVSLLNNICNLVSVRLDSSNYVLWRFVISPLLKSHKLFKYLDGTTKAPTDVIRSEGQPDRVNPKYEKWYERDQSLFTLINATLSLMALSYVIGCKKSKEAWDKLEKHFSSLSRMHIVGLKTELQSIFKKETDSINQYVQRIKEIVNRLLAVSVVVDFEDLVIYKVNGLSSMYNVFKTSLQTRSQNPSFDELYVLMKTEETTLEKQLKLENANYVPHLAMATNFDSQGWGDWRGQGRGGRGRSNSGLNGG